MSSKRRMPRFTVAAAAAEIGLVIVEGIGSGFFGFLPLGGSHLAQLGALLGAGFITDEFAGR